MSKDTETASRYVVESSDTGRVMTDPLDRDAALAQCRKYNAIPAGRKNSGTYRIVASKTNSR